jgi:HrpA-like RNA helicase
MYYTLDPMADYIRATINAVMQIHMTEPEGGILAFLTGQDEILTAHKILLDKMALVDDPRLKNVTVKMLFSALPSELQLEAFSKVFFI